MNATSVQVGSIEVHSVHDGTAWERLDEVIVHDDATEWNCPQHPVGEDGRMEIALGGYLIRTGSRTMLVDAGIGTVDKDHRSGGALVESLRTLGVEAPDVTDVLFTHLHWDHVGWATQRGEVTFVNATHRAHAADWEYFVTGPDAVPGAVRKLSPIESRLEPFDSETELAPGVIARPAPGHTPGSTIFVIADAGQRALLLGDVVHAVGELTDPEWHGLYDLDPVAAKATRDQIAQEAADRADIIAAGHFPALQFGRLITTAERRCFTYL